MENLNTKQNEKITTRCIFIYPSENVNCGIIPDKNGLIYHFGESKEMYSTKYMKILVNDKIDKIEIAKVLRNLADILEGKTEVEYEEWLVKMCKL